MGQLTAAEKKTLAALQAKADAPDDEPFTLELTLKNGTVTRLTGPAAERFARKWDLLSDDEDQGDDAGDDEDQGDDTPPEEQDNPGGGKAKRSGGQWLFGTKDDQ